MCLPRQANLSHVLTSATEICKAAPFGSFDELEDRVALCMKRNCQGTKQEHFSARQVALDVCQRIPTHGLASDGQPFEVRAGPGARAGYFLATGRVAPRYLPFVRQTSLCEYHKLVRRVNFPHLVDHAWYTPWETLQGQ